MIGKIALKFILEAPYWYVDRKYQADRADNENLTSGMRKLLPRWHYVPSQFHKSLEGYLGR